jgi:serine/threonine protein kinase
MTDDSLLGQLAEEFTHRVREGKLPDIEEYARRHPELAGRIRELFPTLMLLEGMAATGDSGAAEAPPSLLSPGSVFGNYRIEREIGRGGMGIVYEAIHVLLEKRVALKVLPVRTQADAGHLERFFREARTAAGLHHTNIVPVFDVGQVAGTPYFAMQYIEGRGLDQILRIMQSAADQSPFAVSPSDSTRDAASGAPSAAGQEIPACEKEKQAVPGPIDASARVRAGLPARLEDYFRWVANMGIQAAEGLAYAHDRKVIHLDIKPSNLLLDKQGVLWIADFGLARKIEDPAMTQSGAVLGTPRYMSPEQAEAAKRPVDQRSDIYSLGATLYELLTCRPVFEGKTPQDVLSQILAREPLAPRRLNPEIPADLATIVTKAMAKRPEDRYQSARELTDDLQHWQKMEPIKARPIGPLGRTIRWCRRSPKLASITAAAATVIIALTGIYIADLTKKNQEIRTALNRAELGIRRAELDAAAIHAALRADVRDYMNRRAEVRKIDQAILGTRKIELFPYVVNHLLLVDTALAWDKETFPGKEQLVAESEKQALEMAGLAVELHDTRFVESIQILGAYFFDEKRDIDRAERLYRQALALMRPVPENRRLMVRLIDKFVPLLEKKADSVMDSGEAGKAAELYRETLQLRREITPQDNLQNVTLERKLGLALTDSRQFEEAEKVLGDHYRLCRARLGETNPSTQMAARSLISLYAAWKKQPGKIAEYTAVLPSPKVISVRDLGTEVFAVSGDGPFSASWGGKEVWAFGHHFLSTPEGRHGFRSSSWLWSDAGQKGDRLGPLQQRTDPRGQPLMLLPFTKDEETFNRARSDPGSLESWAERWSVWPGTVIPLPEKKGALLFYKKCFIRPGGLEGITTLGTSIALWKDPTAPAVRENLRPGTAESTLLFQLPEPDMGKGAHVWGDYLYAYGTRYLKPGNQLIIARVPLDKALQRSAWSFYAGGGQWDPEWQHAVTITNDCCGTVHWNWYLGKFVYMWIGFGAGTLSISTADRPEGPWSRTHQEIPLGRGLTSDDHGIRAAVTHPELSKERGRVVYVTYQQGTGMFRSETRLVELAFK